ncbi:hypothetical protein MAR_023453, partial [Mya arenaria]
MPTYQTCFSQTTRPKFFWNYIKFKKKDNLGVSSLKKDWLAYGDGKQNAELLKDQAPSSFCRASNHTKFQDRTRYLLDYSCPSRIVSMPSKTFQLSLDLSQIPLDLKTALVSPVFKKGNLSSPSNYRPISLTSVSCKFHTLVYFRKRTIMEKEAQPTPGLKTFSRRPHNRLSLRAPSQLPATSDVPQSSVHGPLLFLANNVIRLKLLRVKSKVYAVAGTFLPAITRHRQ